MKTRSRKKSFWTRYVWLLASTAATLMLVGGVGVIILNATDDTSQKVIVSISAFGSFLGGLALAIPVRRAERRALSRDERLSLGTGLGGFALTAVAVAGLTALNAGNKEDWTTFSMLLVGTFAGTASALAIRPVPGARQSDPRDISQP